MVSTTSSSTQENINRDSTLFEVENETEYPNSILKYVQLKLS